jgi:hypothetical protein
MSILGWDALWACASEAEAWHKSIGSGRGVPQLDLSKESMPSSNLSNTVTVTSRGAVIIRLSWKELVCWDDAVRGNVLNACNVICSVLANCC